MARVRPFRALRFAPERVEISRVIAPAACGEEERGALLARDPRNAVRLLGAVDAAADPAAEARRSALYLSEWRRAGVVQRDDTPALYVLRQTVLDDEGAPLRAVTGFFATLDLDEAAERDLRPHEGVHDGVVDALMRRLTTLGASVEPALLLFRDDEGRVRRVLDAEIDEREADVRASSASVRCEMWLVDDETATARVSRLLEEAPLYIADGHHRLTAGLALDELRRQRGGAGGERRPTRAVALFLATDEARSGLAPIHRALRVDAAAAHAALRAAGEHFDRREVEVPSLLPQALADERGPFAFALFVPGQGAFVLSLREGTQPHDLPGVSPNAPIVDAVLAEEAVLGGLLSQAEDDRRARVRYVPDEEVSACLERGDEVLLLLRAPSLDRVLELSDEGARLPEKSTSFSPKPPTGLVMAELMAGGDEDG